MKKKIDSIKQVLNYLKDTFDNPRKKSIIMLIIMVIFFFVVVTMLRNTDTKDYSKDRKTNTYEFSLKNIKSSNYHFVYNIDNKVYEGDRYLSKSVFTNNNDKYYQYKDTLLKDYTGVWQKIDNYQYMEFTDINIIEKLLDSSTFSKKEEYSDGNSIFIYNISTTTIEKLVNNKDIDIADNVNEIKFYTDKDLEVNRIYFDISPYTKYKSNKDVTNIDLVYSNFKGIEKIDDPE